ncbi:MAG: hypothetical protein Q9187_006132 [Circinaria calcarea]
MDTTPSEAGARRVQDSGDRPSKRIKNVDSPFMTESPAPAKRLRIADDIVQMFKDQDEFIRAEERKEQDEFIRAEERKAEVLEWLLKNEAPIEAPHMAPVSESRLSTGGVTEPTLVESWTEQGGPPLPILTPGEGDNGIYFRPTKEEGEVNAIYDEPSRDPVLNDLTPGDDFIIPNIEGFKTHIQCLNPGLAPFLVERMARHQDSRYKKLLNAKIMHIKDTKSGQCESKGFCFALGGSVETPIQRKIEDSTSKLTTADFMTSTYHNSDGGDAREGVITPAQFPPGLPLPPVHRLPAAFECPLCFRVKEICKPSDWLKHVYEDLMPFTCTFPDCSESKAYKRKADWVRHENERHRQLEWWTCNIAIPDIAIPGDNTGRKCGHKCFRRDNFIQHLVREHKLPESRAIRPLSSLARLHTANKESNIQAEEESTIFVDEITKLLATCRERTSNKPQNEPCKFCGNVCHSWKQLAVHHATHMQQISTPILKLVRQKDVTVEDLEIFEESRQYTSLLLPTEAEPNQDIRNPASFYPLWSSFVQPDPLAPLAASDYPTPDIKPNVAFGFSAESLSFDPRLSKDFSYHDRTQISRTVQASAWRDNLQHSNLDMDVMSVASVGTFNDSGFYSGNHSSTGSTSSLQGIPRAAQQEVLLILASDGVLQQLFAEAIRKVSRQRFIRNIKRLIKTYCLDLQEEAQDSREVDATAMLGRHAQWFANRLFDASDPEMTSRQKGMDSLKSQEVDKLYMIENHYERAFPRPVTPITYFDDHNYDTESDDSTGSRSTFNEDAEQGVINYSQFPNLEHIRKFLMTGIPFQNLRYNVCQFVWPEKNEKRTQEPASFTRPEKSGKYAQELTSNAAIAKFCRMADDISSCSKEATEGGSRRSSCSNTKLPVKGLRDSLEDKLDSGIIISNTRPPGLMETEEEMDFVQLIDKVKTIEPILQNIPKHSTTIKSNFAESLVLDEELDQAAIYSQSDLLQATTPDHKPPRRDNTALDSSSHTSKSTNGTDITLSEPEIDYLISEADNFPSDEENLPDCESEQRLLNPKAYFQKLENLEHKIYENSAVRFYKPDYEDIRRYRDPFELRIPFRESAWSDSGIRDDTVLKICNQTGFNGLFQLLECRNLIFRVSDNLRTLQEARFCNAYYFSILVEDTHRRNVARLVPVNIASVHELCVTFESSLESAVKSVNLSGLDCYQGREDSFSKNTEGLTRCCVDMLVSVDLANTADANPTSLWRRAVHILDFAVLAYAGAHIEPIDVSHLGVRLECFAIQGPFADSAGSPETAHNIALECVMVRRRKLQCLDQFLGGKEVWVFHRDSANIVYENMLLSTDAEILADIWGPMWRSTRASDPEHIYEYNIGNGSIMLWPRNEAIDPLPMRTPSNSQEVFCHWVSSRDWNSDALKSHQAGLTKRHFDGSETLLIGADGNIGLRVNDQCIPSVARLAQLKKRFREIGALQSPRTHKSTRYKDSHAVQVQGSAMGFVSVSGTVTYKRREGHTMKDALVECWRNGTRNIVELEAFSGVEVSLCTRNARRRRLLHLLGSQSMRKYLKSISFEWIDDACEMGYFKGLRSPRAFRTFWKQHGDWRRNIGDAVSECLEALQDTGIHQENKELSALWVETFDEEGESDGESTSELDQAGALAMTTQGDSSFEAAEEWIVTLFRSEHTWTGFLKDSPECLTMAVMDSACLDLDGIAGQVAGYGRRCQSHRVRHRDGSIDRWAAGYPVLQTAIELNEEILKDEGLYCEKSKDKGHKRYLDISSLKKDYRFVLGDQGYLRVYTRPSPDAPLIMEWEPVDSETWEELKNVNMKEIMLGTKAMKHHREYIRGTWECSPLSILLVSNSNKPLFCKRGLSL